MSSIFAIIYLAVMVLIWIAYAVQAAHEPTAHGQDVLIPLGCILGFVWPLFLAWMIIVSPWLLFLWWKGELS